MQGTGTMIGQTFWSGVVLIPLVVLNRYPYNNGHLLVAPRVHRGRLDELSGPDLLEPIETVRRMVGILDRMLRPQGYNVGLNRARPPGPACPDTSTGTSYPAGTATPTSCRCSAHTKVIVESLYEFYDRLIDESAQKAWPSCPRIVRDVVHQPIACCSSLATRRSTERLSPCSSY